MSSFIKIKFLFLLPLFMLNTYHFSADSLENLKNEGVNSNTIKLIKVQLLELKAVEINNLKKTTVWKNLTQEGSQIKAKSGFHIVSGKMKKGNTLSMVLKNQKDDKNSIDFTPNFTIVSESPYVIMYCSCGLNVMTEFGDNCFHYQTSSGPVCGGTCEGDNEGKTCSFTSIQLSNGAIVEHIF